MASILIITIINGLPLTWIFKRFANNNVFIENACYTLNFHVIWNSIMCFGYISAYIFIMFNNPLCSEYDFSLHPCLHVSFIIYSGSEPILVSRGLIMVDFRLALRRTRLIFTTGEVIVSLRSSSFPKFSSEFANL